jgi:excisionase family DNA binding protein
VPARELTTRREVGVRKLDLERGRGPEEPLAVRIPQAARMLGVGRSTLYARISSGEIETVKIGRSTLVLTESLRNFLTSHRNR